MNNIIGDGAGGVRIQPDCRPATAPEVQQAMERALETYSKQSQIGQSIDPELAAAASVLLEEMAATKRAERMILWLGPALTLTATGLLFLILRIFIKGL